MHANSLRRDWAAALIVIFVARSASAQIDCSNPDNLCVGDPCTTGDIEVT